MIPAPASEGRTRAGPAELDRGSFQRVARLASAEAGLLMAPAKSALVQSRLARRMRALGMANFREYLDHVESDAGRGEVRQLISALTTNVSHFYRERHHFDMLRTAILPGLLRSAAGGHPVRIWSAGCASGQEPYSIAMEILRLDPKAAERDVRILATDVDHAILETAAAATYPEDAIQGVPHADWHAFFEARPDGRFRVRRKLRELVAFRELNLIAPWPMRRQFDVIFCRNVVIYFDDQTQRRLWPRFQAALAPGGTLFVGHSERIQEMPGLAVRSVGVTAYRNEAAAPPRHPAAAMSEGQHDGA